MLFVSSAKAGTAAFALSLRKNFAVWPAPLPTPTYMRVAPPGSATTSNSARSTSAPVAGFVEGPRGAKICTHVPGSPFCVERQMPFAMKVA